MHKWQNIKLFLPPPPPPQNLPKTPKPCLAQFDGSNPLDWLGRAVFRTYSNCFHVVIEVHHVLYARSSSCLVQMDAQHSTTRNLGKLYLCA